MAAKTKADLEAPGQMELIDVDDPMLKGVKKSIMGYEKFKAEKKERSAADRQVEEKKRKEVLSEIQAAGLKPDALGTYHISLGGKEWLISQEAELKIHKRALKDGEPDEGDEDASEE